MPPPAEQLRNVGAIFASLALEKLNWELFQSSLIQFVYQKEVRGHHWSRPGGRLRSREESMFLTIPRLSCCSLNSFFVGDQADFKIVILLKGLNKEHSKLPVLPLITHVECSLYALICNCCGLGKNCRLNHIEKKMRTWDKNYSPWLSSFNLSFSRFSTLWCKALVQLKKKHQTVVSCLASFSRSRKWF